MVGLTAAAQHEDCFTQPPAVTLVEVSRLYGSDFMIEIEAIAIA